MPPAFAAAEIYEQFGEKDFRDGERRLVARLVEGHVGVIATGGGAFVDPRTRELLNARAITVWLDAEVDVLTERTGRRDTRPLLRNADPKVRSNGSPTSAVRPMPRRISIFAAAPAAMMRWSRRSSSRWTSICLNDHRHRRPGRRCL